MEEVRICLTGGSTGGHFFPLINIAKEFKSRAQEKGWDYKIFYLGAPPFDEQLLKNEGIEVITIPAGKLRRYFDLRNFFDIFKFPFGFIKAFLILFIKMPNLVFSKGGYGTSEVVLAAWLLRIPIIIHESDSIAGLSNRIAGLFASRIAISFESARKYFKASKTALTGQPLDPDFENINPREEIYQKYKLDKNLPLILILGGSQGSAIINEVIIESLDTLLAHGQVVHQMGPKLYDEYKDIAQGFILENIPLKMDYYHSLPFIEHHDLIRLLKMASLVISRAGSGAIFEIAAAGAPSILIPLRENVGSKHQIQNAYEYAHTGAAVVLEERNFTRHIFSAVVNKIMKDKETLENMKKYALEFAKKKATKNIVAEFMFFITE